MQDGSGLVLTPTTSVSHYRAMRAESLQLAQFLRDDFSAMRAEIAAAFPSLADRVGFSPRDRSLFDRVQQSVTQDDVPLRYLPIVRRVARELASLYAAPPFRVWQGIGGQNIRGLVDAYRRQRIDARMLQTQRSLTLQHTQILLVLPGGPDGFRVKRLDPHDVEVIPGNPLYADDLQQAERIRIMYCTRADSSQRDFGVLEMTREHIRWSGSASGPFDEAAGRNPFGGTDTPYPLIVIRDTEPDEGEFFAPVNQPVLQAQIAVNLALTDIERVLRFDAHGYRVLVPGPDDNMTPAMANNITMSVDSLMVLPGVGTDFKIVGGQMAGVLQAYVTFIQRQLEWLAVFLDISPDVLMKSNAAKTAVSRRFDRLDRAENRQAYAPLMAAAERELYAQIRRVAATRGIIYPEAQRVDVTYREGQQIPADPNAEAQALQARIGLGIDSPIAAIAREQGITEAQARAVFARYRQDAATVAPPAPIPPSVPAESGDEADD